MKSRTSRPTTTTRPAPAPDEHLEDQVFDAAIQLRTELGIATYAAQIGVSTTAARALYDALDQSNASTDAERVAAILERGNAELAARLRLTHEGFETWLIGYDEINDCPRDLVTLPALERVRAALDDESWLRE